MPSIVSQRRCDQSVGGRSVGVGMRPSCGELLFEGGLVADQIEDQVERSGRRRAVGGSVGCGAEDRHQGIEAALGVGACQQRGGGVGAVLFEPFG